MVFNREKSFKPIDRVVIFAQDDENSYSEILEIERIENGRIITFGEDYVLPLSDAKLFNSPQGLIYAYRMNFEYLNEIMHLAEVEKNIIIEQAFLYPGRSQMDDAKKSNLMNYVIIGALSLVAIIAMFT